MLHTCPTKNVSNFLGYIYLTIFFVLNNSVKFVISKISKIVDVPSLPPLPQFPSPDERCMPAFQLLSLYLFFVLNIWVKVVISENSKIADVPSIPDERCMPQFFDILLLSGRCQHPQWKKSINTQHYQYLNPK